MPVLPLYTFIYFVVLGFELRASTLSRSTSPFICEGFFQDSILGTICLGWLGTLILLIIAS
jgi:hypothetical protein